ncbi:hypothetical protein [Pseudogemmobacter faecipullorum]|uniref:Lipoprotein n=1 Tax=Pseudogemmobacter faecipullorum TaxID=2755041 RepID=A0ABS8CP94_9RHOB|nr:hypothetical protein [Pseudogemmobacter faecipullorum]MCB5411217.1 hypothetical protein [Pseudogemmobacter faecipullorum]
MKPWLMPLILSLFAACGAQPAPHMFGASRYEAERGGRRYVVFLKGSHVEVIRLGYARNGEHQLIRAQMIGLIAELTGCRLLETTLQGDSGEMRGRVSCPGGPRGPPYPDRPAR